MAEPEQNEPAENPMIEFNQALIEEFRANEGNVGGGFAGVPMLLLTTSGAKSGRKHTTPLTYAADGDRMLVFASKAGAPTNPAWFHNLVANPDATVEVGAETVAVRAEVLTGDERDRLYRRQAEKVPVFAEYQAKTTRVIPVVALTRLG